MKKKIKYLLICMLSVLAVFFASHAVSAASGVNIKSIIVSSEAKAELNLDIKLDTVNRIAVYRSTKPASKGGKYTLVDTVKYYGRVWYSSERNGMCVNGINNKVIFYNDSMSMMGSPVIVDQSKLKLNQTYYYYLEYFSGPNGTETTSVKSVKLKLRTLKCAYAP